MNLLDLARAALPRLAMPTDAAVRLWRIRYPNGAAMDVLFHPPATPAEVIEVYPGASIESLPDASTRTATPAAAGELRRLVNVILADDSGADRAEALAVALADPEAARASYRALAAIR